MTPADVIREMREIAAVLTYEHSEPYVVTSGEIKEWADALEQATREPVGEVEDVIIGASGAFGDHEIRKARRARWLKKKPPVGTKLFPLPPDAAGEIERLREVYKAARGLCYGHDWNKGTHAILHNYRARLVLAVNAIESLPDKYVVSHARAALAPTDPQR